MGLHSLLAKETQDETGDLVDAIMLEHRLSNGKITTYVDLLLRIRSMAIAIEVETTLRHAVDNARKAEIVGIPLWVVVPTRKMKSRLTCRLTAIGLRPGGQPIKVLLSGEVRQEVMCYLSRRIDGQIENKQ